MRARIQPSPELRRLAAEQAGVVTRVQAEGLGLGRHSQQRLIGQGAWQRLSSGLLLTHDQEPTWLSWAWAGVLKGGDHARLGGLAAAHLHGFVTIPPERIDVLHPHGTMRRNNAGPWMFRQERPGIGRSGSVGSPPRTRVEDTVLDLCGTELGATEGEPPIHWVTLAVQHRLTTPAGLSGALGDRRRISCRSELTEILSDVAEGAQSPIEWRYLRGVERAHGLPQGARQAPARQGSRRVFRDVRYEKYGLLVELDGRPGHTGPGRFRDFRRDNAAILGGEATLRYGDADVRYQGCRVALQVAEMLIRGGWAGMPSRCPNCPGGGADAFWP